MSNDRLLTASLVLSLAASAHAQTHVYVDDDAPPRGDGLSWNSALSDLHDAIDLAKALGQNRGEIRIAGGTYKPDRGTGNQFIAFRIPIEQPNDRPYTLRGGFAGLDLPSDPDIQNPTDYPSVLNADLLGDDASTGSISDNSATILILGDESNPSVSTASAIVLEGLTFRSAVSSAVRAPVSAVSLVLRDCNFNENLGGTGAVMRLKNAMVTIERCSFESNQVALVIPGQPGDGVLDLEGCHAIMSDSAFVGNRQSGNIFSDAVGAAISMRESEVVIVDSIFRDNIADDHGGAISAEDSSLSIYRSRFDSNTSNRGYGGAIYMKYGPANVLTLNYCVLSMNSADGWGGAVYSPNAVFCTGTTFTSNSGSPGGAFAGRIIAKDTDFVSNSSTSNGGAAILISGSAIENCTLSQNTGSSGGAIDMASTSLQSLPTIFRDSLFEFNEARHSGGAIRDPYTDANDGQVTIESCQFRQNSSLAFGGAVSGTNSITGSLFEENTAVQGGGAVHEAESLEGSTFRENSTQGAGGALLNMSAVTRSLFINNRSSVGGAAIDATNRDLAITDSAFIESESPAKEAFVTVSKTGTGNLDLTRSTMAGTVPSGSRFIDLTGGDHWIESSVIWNQAESAEATIQAQNIERLIILHSDVSPNSIDIDNPDDYFDLGGNISSDPLFVDAEQANIRLSANSPCIDAGLSFVAIDAGALDVYGEPRTPIDVLGVPNAGQGVGGFLDIGATEYLGTSCLADTNFDGNLTPTDFTAWLAAYNAGASIADQNRDNALTPADFTAWLANYNAGCP